MKNSVTIIQILRQLPEKIDYVGYRFTLSFNREKNFLGYYVSECYSKNKKKREAFKMGIWYEKKPRLRLSSCESNYIFKVPLMNDDDLELFFTIDFFIEYLTKIGFIKKQTETIEPEFVEYQTVEPFLLNSINP
jgi:hypothetical protein